MKEADLQKDIGVSRDKLRWIRRGLEAGVHFLKEGRSVVYTELGIVAVRGKIAEELGAEPKDVADGTNGTDGPRIEELTVVRTVRNPRIVIAALSQDGEQRVIVRSNENFLPRMKLRARWLHDDLWQLEGRCPRWRGRW